MRSIIPFSVVVLFATAGIATEIEAQDLRTEAVMAYNNARELAQNGEYLDAIEMYREAGEIAASAECEGCEDITDFVEEQLPRIYYSRAGSAFETFRSERSPEAADRAVQYFREAQEAGEEFGDDQVANNSRAVIPQVYYNKALLQHAMEDYEGEIESLDTAIELNPNYTLAYYQKALTLNRMDAGIEEVMEWFDRAIEVGQEVGDTQNVNRAQQRAGEELIYRAVQRLEEERLTDALNMLQRAEGYVPDSPELHYRFAEVYNNRGSSGDAIEHANRALELASGGVADLAKIHFELGVAYKAQENKDQACSAFENAAYGDFQGPARYELEFELECEGYASAGN